MLEHGRRDVLQRAVGTQGEAARVAFEIGRGDGVFGGDDERYRISGVRSLRAAGCGIDHLLGVAVVGGDDHRSSALA